MVSYNAGLFGLPSDPSADPREDQTGEELALEAGYIIPSGAWYGYGTFVNKPLSKESTLKLRYEEFPQ